MKKKPLSGDMKRIFTNKLLGQHFLTSQSILENIIQASNIKKGDVVLEIGPGKGALTRALLDAEAHVIAIEKDPQLAELLKKEFAENKNFSLILGDVLKTDIAALKLIDDSFLLVANIPYYITAKILRMFLENTPRPHQITLMVQHEVAHRIAARPPQMNLLALSVQAYGIPKIIKKVSKKYFRPQPKVDSAIITITDIGNEFFQKNNIKPEMFFQKAKKAFSQKRKTLKNSLGIVSKKRPQELSLEEWAKIAKG